VLKPDDGRAIRLPACVALYDRNAFQVLGLNPVKSTTRLILKRRDELQALLEAGLPIREHVPDYRPVGWPWADAVSVDELRRAVGKLQQEPSRFEEEVCWFHLDDEDEPLVLQLVEGNLEAARAAWQGCRTNGASPYRAGQALHNLAVLQHAQALAAERAAANRGVFDGDQQAAHWREALRIWAEVHSTESAWEYFDLRRVYVTDPRINEKFCANLRSSLPARVLRVNLEIARAAVAQDNYAYARAHLDLLRSSPFPDASKAALLAEFAEPYAMELRALVQPLVQAKQKLSVNTDYAGLVKEIERIRSQLRTLGVEGDVAFVATEVVRAVKKPAADELRAVISDFNDSDTSMWKKNNFLVGEWNKRSNRSELRAICEVMGQNKPLFAELDTKLKNVVATASQSENVLKVLDALCVPGSDAVSKLVVEELKFAREWASKVRAEVAKTRKHFDENYGGMRRQLGM
jgi:hypothetical protein